MRAAAWAGAGLLTCAIGVLVAWWAWGSPGRPLPFDIPDLDLPPATVDCQTESRIAAFCGDCHALPCPESFPRDRWHDGVRAGYEHYARSGRNDLEPPPIHETLAYYRSGAPQRLVFPQPVEASTALRATFTVEKRDWHRNAGLQPAVSCLRWGPLGAGADPVLLACDMRDGSIAAVDLRQRPSRPKILARLNHPCHLEPCDLDGSGAIGLVVADLGSFSAVDHNLGRVVWLRRGGKGDRSNLPERPGGCFAQIGPVPFSTFEPVVLASGLGRVADVRPVDVDGDGDLDLIVAEFGHQQTGSILLLRDIAPRGERPRFATEKIDSRTGTIHVPVCDLNRDGRLDFVALISNESESVEAFLNRGKGKFVGQTLWRAPDLTFGSSGIELVDMDRDGDLDVLYTNGDSFDNLYANPSHGVQWLENLGPAGWAYHRLADLPGAYRALAGDLDLDGDLDIVVTAWLPQQVRPPELKSAPLGSILCLEQTSPRRFVCHTLEAGSPRHAVLEMGDFDGDGDLDFAVGFHTGLDGASAPSMPRLAVWWNQAISTKK